MTEKTVLITGATSGIGLLTARELASLGARVIITGRDGRRGDRAAVELRSFARHDRVHFVCCEGVTLAHHRELAETVAKRFPRLDVLINHVEVSYGQRWETEDGHEATLAMNLLGPHALTLALLPLLEQSAPSRIINVTSGAFGTIMRDPFDDIHAKRHYDGHEVSARSKMLRVLWTFALARKLEPRGVMVNAADSDLTWHAASKTSVFLASSDDPAHVTGSYFEDPTKRAHTTMRTLDLEDQERAWDLCATLTAQRTTPRGAPHGGGTAKSSWM
ncbi:SDR family NAD(P)-dependent oxidoreductase [Pendulispora albinea]|uniref:SDR family NAD(P)-dependent oxidoreductase n=1 Tax=Pendulispora albinea TaxID=2741071 RepID=A0ABZ2M5I1_9BACT